VNHSDDFSALFETGGNHRFVNKIGDQRIRGDKYVSARDENWHQQSSETFKEAPQRQPVVIG